MDNNIFFFNEMIPFLHQQSKTGSNNKWNQAEWLHIDCQR